MGGTYNYSQVTAFRYPCIRHPYITKAHALGIIKLSLLEGPVENPQLVALINFGVQSYFLSFYSLSGPFLISS